MKKYSDKDILDKYRSNDNKAAQIFVDTYKAFIYSICFKMLGDSSYAHCCTQETFMKIYQDNKPLKYKGALNKYIARIARNTCVDKIRRDTRYKMALKRYHKMQESSGKFLWGTSNVNKHDIVDDKIHQKVKEFINNLPKSERKIFDLKMDGMKYVKIAEHLSLSYSAVSTTMYNIRRKLKELLNLQNR